MFYNISKEYTEVIAVFLCIGYLLGAKNMHIR